MFLKPARFRAMVRVTLALLLLPRAAHAQDFAAIFANLGKFVSGFDAGEVYVAPAGFIESKALERRGHLQQVGLALRNPDLDISIGYDLLTGIQAKEESLDLRGSVASLPTINKYFITTFPKAGPIVPTATLGVGLGLSQLQDARAALPQTSGADHSVKLTGNGYHFSGSVSVGASFGEVGFYVQNEFRYTRFPSLDWTDDKSIVPPAGWPTSMDFWTGTVRIGFGIGVK